MKLWTLQLAQWRVAKQLNVPVLDTTFKSGDVVFAPPRKLVMDYKAGIITAEQYTAVYLATMRESYRIANARWMEVLQMEEVAFACYCPEGRFCHRHLLTDMFVKIGQAKSQDIILMGELGKRHV